MVDALKEAIDSVNYTLYCGMQYNINDRLKLLPAAWLLPAKLIKTEGCKRGNIIYETTIYLMCAGKHLSEDQKTECWDRLESDALEIYKRMADHPDISSVGGLQCVADEFSLSNHGELSITMKFSVEMPFLS